jgi:hypothetical protein
MLRLSPAEVPGVASVLLLPENQAEYVKTSARHTQRKMVATGVQHAKCHA